MFKKRLEEVEKYKRVIPLELQELKRFLLVKKDSKVPISAKTLQNASVTNPSDYHSFKGTLQTFYHNLEYEYLGYAFSEEDGFVGIDFDKCFLENYPNLLTHEIEEIVNMFSSYTEVSKSGKGIHILIKANLNGISGLNNLKGVEIYQDKRYFVLTANLYKNRKGICYSEIKERQAELELLIKKYFSKLDTSKKLNKIYEPPWQLPELVVGNKYKFFLEPKFYAVYEGGRHMAMLSFVGSIKNLYSIQEVYKLCLRLNALYFKKPMKPSEVLQIIKSAYTRKETS